MKYTVKVQDQTFEVEVGDLATRPIRATIGGEVFEVWPETPGKPAKNIEAPRAAPTPPPSGASGIRPLAPTTVSSGTGVKAPIPGVIVAINVAVGDTVSVGQELCVLEAMKMRTPIRAARAGKIAEVRVSVGQQVKHHEVLVTYAAE